ncbi:MAG: hypothetical protein COT00_00005, partial [Candidatus Omnitrophica bacterium CG07_land_8_20_14_0_80_50_8]
MQTFVTGVHVVKIGSGLALLSVDQDGKATLASLTDNPSSSKGVSANDAQIFMTNFDAVKKEATFQIGSEQKTFGVGIHTVEAGQGFAVVTVRENGTADVASLTVYDPYLLGKTPTVLFGTPIAMLDFNADREAAIKIGEKTSVYGPGVYTVPVGQGFAVLTVSATGRAQIASLSAASALEIGETAVTVYETGVSLVSFSDNIAVVLIGGQSSNFVVGTRVISINGKFAILRVAATGEVTLSPVESGTVDSIEIFQTTVNSTAVILSGFDPTTHEAVLKIGDRTEILGTGTHTVKTGAGLAIIQVEVNGRVTVGALVTETVQTLGTTPLTIHGSFVVFGAFSQNVAAVNIAGILQDFSVGIHLITVGNGFAVLTVTAEGEVLITEVRTLTAPRVLFGVKATVHSAPVYLNDLDRQAQEVTLQFGEPADNLDMEMLDRLVEYLSLKVDTEMIRRANINGDELIDQTDLDKLDWIVKTLRDVNGDGFVDMKDVEKIEQMIGADKTEQTITPEEIGRADIDGNGVVNYLDLQELEKLRGLLVDVNGDGNIGEDINNSGIFDDVERINLIINFNKYVRDNNLHLPEELAKADLNNDQKVTPADVTVYTNAFNMLYGNKDDKTKSPKADFNHDGIVDYLNDRNYLRDLVNIAKDPAQKGITEDIQTLFRDLRRADFNGDMNIDEQYDLAALEGNLLKLVDVDGNQQVGPEDLERILKIIDNQRYFFTPGEVAAADMDKDTQVTEADVLAFAQAVLYLNNRDLNNDGTIDSKDVGLIANIANYLKTKKDLKIDNLLDFDIDGNGVLNGTDVTKFVETMNCLPDFDKNNIIEPSDDTIFNAIYDASLYGRLETSYLNLPVTQVRVSDINDDGLISLKDRTLLKNAVDGQSTDTALYDINEDSVVDQADLDRFDLIRKYIDPEEMRRANVDGIGGVDAADANKFEDEILTLYTGANALPYNAAYDINGDDVINYNDLTWLKHIVSDYLGKPGITKENFIKADVYQTDAEKELGVPTVDHEDWNRFKNAFGKVNALDVDHDGFLRPVDDRIKMDEVVLGKAFGVRVFSDDLVNRADLDDLDGPDEKDQELLQGAIDSVINSGIWPKFGQESQKDQKLVNWASWKAAGRTRHYWGTFVDPITKIKEFVRYDTANKYLKEYDLDQSGKVDTDSERNNLKDELHLTDNEAQDMVTYINTDGVNEAEIRRANLDSNKNEAGNDLVDDRDYDILEKAINDQHLYDLTGDQKNREADKERLLILINYIQTGRISEDLLPVIFKGDLNNSSGTITQDDLDLMDQNLVYLKDMDGDAQTDPGIDAGDINHLTAISTAMGMGVDLAWISGKMGDIDKDEDVDADDAKKLEDAIKNASTYDIDKAKGLAVSSRDEEIIREIIYKKITVAGLSQADINKDGIVNRADENALREAVLLYVNADINNDRLVNAKDLLKWAEVKRYQELQKLIPVDLIINKVGDITGPHGVPDGVVDTRDRQALANSLSKIAVDLNHDGKKDQGDYETAVNIISAMSNNHVSLKDMSLADVDGNGVIEQKDVDLIQAAYEKIKDYNGDGNVGSADVDRLSDVIEYITVMNDYGKDKLRTADIDGDGFISEDEKKKMIATMNHYIDITDDGIVDMRDLDKLNKILTFIRLDVKDDDLKRADLNGDGSVNSDDETELRAAMQIYKKADVNLDGSVDDEDAAEIEKIVNFLTANPTADLTAFKAADVNGDGKVDGADVDWAVNVRSKLDFVGEYGAKTDGKLTQEDAAVMEKILGYFALGLDSYSRRYADVDGNGVVEPKDAELLREYIELARSGDMPGNGSITHIKLTLPGGMLIEEDVTDENSTVQENGDNTMTLKVRLQNGSILEVVTSLLEKKDADNKLVSSHAILSVRLVKKEKTMATDASLTEEGLVQTVSHASGAVTKFTFEADGRLKEAEWIDPQGHSTKVELTVENSKVTENADQSRTIFVSYPAADGRMITLTIGADGRTIAAELSDAAVAWDRTTAPADSSTIFGDLSTIHVAEGLKAEFTRAGDGEITEFEVDKVDKILSFLEFDFAKKGIKVDYIAELGGYIYDRHGRLLNVPMQKISSTGQYLLAKADLDNDGKITAADKKVIQDILNKALDVNHDDVIDNQDSTRITEVLNAIKMNVTDEDIRQVDMVNERGEYAPDGMITGKDILVWNNLFKIFSNADVNGVPGVDEKDVLFIQNMFDYVNNHQPIAKEVVDKADLNRDGKVDDVDKQMLVKILNQLQDLNKDGLVNEKDAEELLRILTAMQLNVTDKDVLVSDVDKNGKVDLEDKRLLEASIAIFNKKSLDMNADEVVNGQDVEALVLIYNNIKNGNQVPLEDLTKQDIAKDGVINEADVQEFFKVLSSYVDLNGDGFV